MTNDPHSCPLTLDKGHTEVFRFAAANTKKTDIIVGFNWFQKHNPSVNWKTGDITFDHCPLECGMPSAGRGRVRGGWRLHICHPYFPEEEREWIASAHMHLKRLAEEAQKEKWKKLMEEMVPAHYLEQFQEGFKNNEFKFDMIVQGTKTIQDLLNDLTKYLAQMIHLPNIYMFCKWFVSELHNTFHNEVLKKRLYRLNSYLKLLE